MIDVRIHNPTTGHIHTPLPPVSSLWPHIHPDDKPKLAAVLTALVLTKINPDNRILVRACTDFDTYVPFSVALRYGTQGIHCTMWAWSKA